MTAAAPYRYFRIEARDIAQQLGRDIMLLETTPGTELVARLLRLAHTLKGAARVVKQRAIAEQAHAIEDALAPLRDGFVPAGRTQVDAMLRQVDAINAAIDALEPAASPGPVASTAAKPALAVEEHGRILRADVAEMDALLDGIAEAGMELRLMRRSAGMMARARQLTGRLAEEGSSATARELGEVIAGLEDLLGGGMDRAERELRQLREAAERLRLLPASLVYPALQRTLRDVCQALGKQAAFEGSGGDIRLDADVLGAVQGALIQLVRNAAAHGIEAPAVRVAAGKPETGRVRLLVRRRGNRVAFICGDDGAGIDLAAIGRAAQARGTLPPGAGDDEVLRVLLRGGFSTSTSVTELSGRGVGLDVLRETAERLRGTLDVRTEPGQGARFELVVPVTLSAQDALVVEAAGIVAALPLAALRRTLRLAADAIARTPDRETIMHEGRAIPYVPLARLLRSAAAAPPAGGRSVLVVEGAGGIAAIGVDRLLGMSSVVTSGLPTLAPVDAAVAGAALDSEGVPQLVLDPDAVVAAACGAAPPALPAMAGPALPILVIDDSLTTRMLEQSILESAGYEAEFATSAEEGLEKAARRRYGLFLVDVEMPGMDGFSFIERTRADPDLREVPAILLTSRYSAEDRERAIAAGAGAHIAKGDFDQARFLDAVRRLKR